MSGKFVESGAVVFSLSSSNYQQNCLRLMMSHVSFIPIITMTTIISTLQIRKFITFPSTLWDPDPILSLKVFYYQLYRAHMRQWFILAGTFSIVHNLTCIKSLKRFISSETKWNMGSGYTGVCHTILFASIVCLKFSIRAFVFLSFYN